MITAPMDPRDWASRQHDEQEDPRGWAARHRDDLEEIDSLIRKGAGPTGSGGGEGSRGGHVIGHLKSGKPIYESKGHTSAQQLVSHVEEKHTGLTAAEHGEAAKLHRGIAAKEGKGSTGVANYHEAHARAHELVGANKGLAEHFGGSVAGGLAHGMDHSAGGLQTEYGRQRAAVGATPPEHAARDATAARDADRATAKLSGFHGSPEEHTHASGLHGAAANVERSAGNEDRAKHHEDMAAQHAAFAKQGGGTFNSDKDYTKGDGGKDAAGFDKAKMAAREASQKHVLPGGGLGPSYSLSPTQKAEGATKKANAASQSARELGDPSKATPPGQAAEAHRAAALAHEQAANAHSHPHNKDVHQGLDDAHEAAADAHEAGDKANESRDARAHRLAANAHKTAAKKFDEAGHLPLARQHERLSQEHANEADNLVHHPGSEPLKRRVPPEQNPTSKVREKLTKSKTGAEMDAEADAARSPEERERFNASKATHTSTAEALKAGQTAKTPEEHHAAARLHEKASKEHGAARNAFPSGTMAHDIHHGLYEAHNLARAAHDQTAGAIQADEHPRSFTSAKRASHAEAARLHTKAAKAFDATGYGAENLRESLKKTPTGFHKAMAAHHTEKSKTAKGRD